VPRAFAFELVAKEPRAAGDPARFERAVSALLQNDLVAVWHAVDERGALHVAIVRRVARSQRWMLPAARSSGAHDAIAPSMSSASTSPKGALSSALDVRENVARRHVVPTALRPTNSRLPNRGIARHPY
jgi:hypothetical protein